MKLKIHWDDEVPINSYLWTPRAERQPLHYHDGLELGLCLEGRGTFTFSDKQFPIFPGDVFVVNNRELHIAVSSPEDPCRFVFVNFDVSIPLAADESLLMPFAYHPGKFSNRLEAGTPGALAIAPLVVRVQEELRAKKEGYRALARALVVQICVEVLRTFAGSLGEVPWERSVRDFGKKRDLLAFMESRFQDPVTLADLAAYMEVSESAASRAFTQVVGRTFKEQLADLRVQEAKRRLVSTDASVTDICFSSGFQSLPSFYRTFLEIAGVAPAAFRTAHPASQVFDEIATTGS